jgi:hypothetical protein
MVPDDGSQRSCERRQLQQEIASKKPELPYRDWVAANLAHTESILVVMLSHFPV